MTRVIGLDIHRVFAEAVVLDTGKIVPLGKIGMTRQHLRAFACRLTHDDHVVRPPATPPLSARCWHRMLGEW